MDAVEIPVGDLVFTGLAAGPEDGPLVLLLHGFPQTSYEWRAQLGALAERGYRAVAPDQRGYSPGARPEGVEQYHLRHLVADVVALADWLGGHRFHLVGHDWGAVVAWVVAARYPTRLRTLTSVSTPHPRALSAAMASPTGDQRSRSAYIAFFRQPELPERFLASDDGSGLRALFANSGYPEDREAMERYVGDLSDPGALTAALNWYRAVELSAFTDVGSVTVPTLYVWGREDPALGREAAEGTAAHVDGPYRFEALDGIGHWIPEEAPDELNRLLVEHVAAWS